MLKIEQLSGREVLDSRGRPTVLATCVLEGGIGASASVPSGATTGGAEAFELRDGDPKRYRGLGCRRAAANIGAELHNALAGRAFDQAELDQAMIALDGTATKSRIGANAILAVSVAFARACALARGVPLYRHFADIRSSSTLSALPRLTINLFSGGKHAGQQVSVQDVLIIPMSAQTVDQALVSAFDVYQAA